MVNPRTPILKALGLKDLILLRDALWHRFNAIKNILTKAQDIAPDSQHPTLTDKMSDVSSLAADISRIIDEKESQT